MDIRYHWRVRIATLLGAATLIVVALWASDFKIGSFDVAQAWQSVRDWWHKEWFPEKDEKQAVAPQLPTPVSATGAPIEATKPLPGTDSSVSKVPQPLILVSTSRGRNLREGTARLGTHPENPQTYAAGAILANGSRLLEIYDDHVVLERDGKRANLYLASSGKKSNTSLAMVGGEEPVKVLTPSHTESLTDYIRPSPVFDGPTLRGYEVYAGAKSGVFHQLGLQNGDVILSLNEQPLVEPKQAIELMNQLTTGMPMSATIERKGKIERLSLDGRVITQDQEVAKQTATVPPAPDLGR